MGGKDPRVDVYINKSADFAKPILRHLRKVVHEACPDVQETMKWSFPHFMHNGMLCGMASFKEHCAFGFWKGSLLNDEGQGLETVGKTAMGHLGRITSLDDLPGDKKLVALVKKAAALNEKGVKAPATVKKPKGMLEVPGYFMSAIKKNKKALAAFEGFSPSHKREYVEWITEAKGEDTRKRRMETAVAWMAEGKARNWKYMKT